jgi:uncharacterized phage-associated protein
MPIRRKHTPQKTLAAANYFLSKAAEEGVPIDPLKLQKLVYFAHGWHLAVTGEPLIDEHVEAWPYGPVIPSLYHRFKSYGADPITDLVYVRGPTGELYPPLPTDTDTLNVLNKVWQQYGRYSAVQLSNLSHATGSPWEQTWNQREQNGTRIDNGKIHRHFLSAARSRQVK